MVKELLLQISHYGEGAGIEVSAYHRSVTSIIKLSFENIVITVNTQILPLTCYTMKI